MTSPKNPESIPEHQQQKTRSGLRHLWYTTGYAVEGLQYAFRESSYRQELLLFLVMSPFAFYLGQNWLETVFLISVLWFVLIVEILNTAIEVVVDRFGGEWHPLSKHAKDLGGAAVMLSLILAAGVWLSAIYMKFGR